MMNDEGLRQKNDQNFLDAINIRTRFQENLIHLN